MSVIKEKIRPSFKIRVRRGINRFKEKYSLIPMLKRGGKYIFTDKIHPRRGIMSFFLGVISIVTIIFSIRDAFLAGGAAASSSAGAVMLAFVYSIAGVVLGIKARKQKDVFLLFPNAGLFLNILDILCIVGMVILGSL